MILLVDNYDSFVFNLARYFERLGHSTRVVRNDEISVAGVRELAPESVVISPGPCTPNEAGRSLDVVRELVAEVPILGVCLGHQVIAAALGAKIIPAAEPMHGRTSEVLHDGRGVFRGAPSPLTVCRYHSLVVDEKTLPDCLEVSARTRSGTVMALRHRQFPVIGVQFHPESILTDAGFAMLAGFLRAGGISTPRVLPDASEERPLASSTDAPLPDTPVTF